MGRNRKFQSVVRHQLEALNEPHCKPSCVSACTPRAHKHSQIKLSEHERRSRGTEATAFEIHGRYQDADCSHLPSNVLEPSRPQPFEPSDEVDDVDDEPWAHVAIWRCSRWHSTCHDDRPQPSESRLSSMHPERPCHVKDAPRLTQKLANCIAVE